MSTALFSPRVAAGTCRGGGGSLLGLLAVTRLRVLAAALAATLAVTVSGCQPEAAGHPADCHSPSPYSLYDRPGL